MNSGLALLGRLCLVAVSLGALAAAGGVPPTRVVQPYRLSLPAPRLAGRTEDWLNTGGQRLEFARGRVYVVEFWTFGCVNCQRNLPAYARWQQRFARQQLTIIGVHTPETDDERNAAKVREQVRKLGITYPVLLDPDRANWERWEQQIWPAVYLVDKRGYVRYRWLGELEWQHAGGEAKMTRCIEQLLAEPVGKDRSP